MGVQVPCRFHAEVPQEAAVWTDQAAPGTVFHAYPDIDPAEVFGGGGYWVFEREELDLDCAERGTQATQFPGPQILRAGILCFDRRAGRGDDPRLHQKAGDGGQAIGSIATEARHLMTSQLSSQNPL